MHPLQPSYLEMSLLILCSHTGKFLEVMLLRNENMQIHTEAAFRFWRECYFFWWTMTAMKWLPSNCPSPSDQKETLKCKWLTAPSSPESHLTLDPQLLSCCVPSVPRRLHSSQHFEASKRQNSNVTIAFHLLSLSWLALFRTWEVEVDDNLW